MESATITGLASRAVAAAIAAMRRAPHEHAVLLAFRDGVEAVDPLNDRKALDALISHAVNVEHVDPKVALDIVEQGREMVRLTRSYPTYESGPTWTAQATIDSLLFSLRDGLSCLKDAAVCNRLRHCDEAAVRAISKELLTWRDRKNPLLPPWTNESVAKLLTIWQGLKK